MSQHASQTALVTGATSGLGFEAAAQLAEAGFGRIFLTARSTEKGEAARARLVERVGSDPFQVLAIDMGKLDTVHAAVGELQAAGGSVDYALLNAGLVASSEIRRVEGIEITVAASLTGHHVLTTGLLAAGLLSPEARIVIAGSEAARNDVPGFGFLDLGDFAREHFSGDRSAAIQAVSRVEGPYVYKNMPHYGLTKLFVAWWSAALSRRLPTGMAVYAISPGASAGTSAGRNQGAPIQFMFGLMASIGHWFGMNAPIPVAAARYLAGIELSEELSGSFYASKPGKMTGPVVVQTQPHVLDRESQEATWSAMVALTGASLSAVQEVA